MQCAFSDVNVDMLKFVKQSNTLPVISFTNGENQSKSEKRKHSVLLPNTIRCIICGPSNCGKTNVMLNLLCHKNGVRFENVYIYSKSLAQSKYVELKKFLDSIKEIKSDFFPIMMK